MPVLPHTVGGISTWCSWIRDFGATCLHNCVPSHICTLQDPRFEELKAQTEQLMQEPGFVEEMSKALMSGGMGKTFADMGMSLSANSKGDPKSEK